MPSVKSLLKKYGIVPKKRLGQHFLAETPTIEKIIKAAGFTPEDTVLEIGSGIGVMTAMTAQRVKNVIAVERDHVLFDAAKTEFIGFDNISWLNTDILKLDIRPFGQLKLIGNLPYNISSPIIFWILENRAQISSALFMMQKEVALRIAAAPGGKDYGILSVLLQARADCKKLFDVSPKNFVPPPEVVSSVVKIQFGKTHCRIEDEKTFTALVKAAFGKRRKTLRNALIGAGNLHIDPNLLDEILTKINIDGKRRPETVGVDEFARLSNAFGSNHRNSFYGR